MPQVGHNEGSITPTPPSPFEREGYRKGGVAQIHY